MLPGNFHTRAVPPLGIWMHYYQFNIGDYKSHTEHLSEMEDLAYRRLLDWYYLHEFPIPLDVQETARQIRMRSHCECIAMVLREFFEETENGWIHHRANRELEKAGEKSSKASESAKARWNKHANALRTQSESNATHNTRHITQDTVDKRSPNGSRLPQDWTLPEDWKAFCQAERPDLVPSEVAARFSDYWHGVAGAKGRKADWAATWRNWVRGEKKIVATAVQQVTVPAKQGIDPALAKIIAEQNIVKPMPPEIRAKLRQG